jgi:hypothetical protein
VDKRARDVFRGWINCAVLISLAHIDAFLLFGVVLSQAPHGVRPIKLSLDIDNSLAQTVFSIQV